MQIIIDDNLKSTNEHNYMYHTNICAAIYAMGHEQILTIEKNQKNFILKFVI